MNQWQKLGQLQAPVGQDISATKNDKKTKMLVRYEIDLSQSKVKKRDVHAGTSLNPLINLQVNQEDSQVKEMVSYLNQTTTMGNGDADNFIEKYAKQPIKVKSHADIIESHQIEAMMGALQNEESYMILEKICVQYRIQDVSEFNFERLAQKQDIFDQNKTYELFGRDKYIIQKMNPYQLAIIFNNLKALRYMTIRLNQHLRLSLNAPELNHGGLQIKEANQIKRECWPLFVAINNKNLKMLMFLWQDLGNKYNISVGTGYGNINSKISIKLGQDVRLRQMGVKDFQDLMQQPLAPSSEQKKLTGNGNKSKLWDQTHLQALIQTLAEQRYIDGLKFVLTSEATHQIYNSMSVTKKIQFLSMLFQDNTNIEISEILKLKLTEAPYATLSIFTLIQLDQESLENLKLRKQALMRQQTNQTVRGESIYQSFRSVGNTPAPKQIAPVINNFKKLFKFINANPVHLEFAIQNLQLEEFVKLKYESGQKYFEQFVTKNLDLILKASKRKDHMVHALISKLHKRVMDFMNQAEDREISASLMEYVKKSVREFIYNQNLKKNWLDYEEIATRQLFYWAKVGEFEKFFKAAIKYNICCFSRVKIIYSNRTQRRATIAKYHGALKEDDVSSENSDLGRKTPRRIQSPPSSSRKRKQEYDEFQYEYQLADVSPEIELFRDGMEAQVTPLLIAIQYKHFDIVRYIMEQMQIDLRMSLSLVCDSPIPTIEQLSYSLLIACTNQDFLMLRYLWEKYGSTHWVLDHLRVLMKQLISQQWLEAIDMIFDSENTQQMVKSLSSTERSCFIEEYIGNPFAQYFDHDVRNCLINNFCKQPYAGALVILLIEYFEELNSVKRKTAGGDKVIIVALGHTPELAAQEFQKIWNQCLENIQPIEIQVLRETCNTRFTEFVEKLDQIAKKDGDHRIQAIRLIQLFRGTSNYRGIFEPIEPEFSSDSEDDSEHLLQHQFYKSISNQTLAFSHCFSKAPHKVFLKHLIQGNIEQLSELIEKYELKAQDILEMRGGEFQTSEKINTGQWNPVHWAVYYRQIRVLQMFKEIYGSKMDLLWVMKMEDALYGYELTIKTKNLQIMEFLYNNSECLDLKDIIKLLKHCHNWSDGVLYLIKSSITKNQFILSQMEDKISFVSLVLSMDFLTSLIPFSHQDDYLESSPITKQLKSQLYFFPYVSVIWVLDSPLLESAFDFRRYMDTMQLNFDQKSINMLESIDQVHTLINFCQNEQILISAKNSKELDEIQQEIASFKENRETEYETNGLKKDLEQKLQDIENLIKEKKIIFQYQNKMIEMIKSNDLRQKGEYVDLCQGFVDEILFPETDLDDSREARDFEEKSLGNFKEILHEENIIYLQSMFGFESENSELKNLPKIITQNKSDFEGIDLSQLNCLHWIILSRREDLFNFVMEHYFKAGSKTPVTNSLIPSTPQPSVEPQVLFSCLRGRQDLESFKVIGYEGDFSNKKSFTYQLKGAGPHDGLDIEFSEEVTECRLSNLQLSIPNLGFALIIITKSSKFLRSLLKLHPTIFISNIIPGVLFGCVKQWNAGVNIMLDQFEIEFSKIKTMEKMKVVQQVFAIQKFYKNQNTQSSCETLLQLPKIRAFIVWVEDKIDQILAKYCVKMFLPEAQKMLQEGQDQQMDESTAQLFEEMEELMKVEKQCFLDGKYSNMFQKILAESAKSERYQIGSKKERDINALEFQQLF